MSFVLNWQEWGTGAIDMTLAHARFLWAGAKFDVCRVIGGGSLLGWVEETPETAILG